MTTSSSLDNDVVQTTYVDVDDKSFEAIVRLVVPIVFGLVTVVGLVDWYSSVKSTPRNRLVGSGRVVRLYFLKLLSLAVLVQGFRS